MSNERPPFDWRRILIFLFLFLLIIVGLNPPATAHGYSDNEFDGSKKYFSFGKSPIDIEAPVMSLWSTCNVYIPSYSERLSLITSYNNQILQNYNSNTPVTSVSTDHLLFPYHYVVTEGYVSDYLGAGEFRYYDSEGNIHSLPSDYENKVYMLCIYGVYDELTNPYFLSASYTGTPSWPNYLGANVTEKYDSSLSHYYFTNYTGYKLYFGTNVGIFYEFYMSVDGRNWYIPCTYYLDDNNTSRALLNGVQLASGTSFYYGPILTRDSGGIQLSTKFSTPVVYSDFDLITTSTRESSRVSIEYSSYDYKIGSNYVYKIISATPLPASNLNGGNSGDSSDPDNPDTPVDPDNPDIPVDPDNPADDETDESIFKKALRAVFGNFLDTFEALGNACESIFELLKTLYELVVYRFTNGELNFALPYYFFTLARAGITVLAILIVIKFLK